MQVAKVDKHGIITAVNGGQANITVTTSDGGHTASAIVKVEGEEIPEFVGDFPDMNVPASKVFTVTFNQELDDGKDYSKAILIAREADGKAPVSSFTAKVDPSNPTKLLIKPTTSWEPGEYYMTVTTATQNKNGKALKENIRMKFTVEVRFKRK